MAKHGLDSCPPTFQSNGPYSKLWPKSLDAHWSFLFPTPFNNMQYIHAIGKHSANAFRTTVSLWLWRLAPYFYRWNQTHISQLMSCSLLIFPHSSYLSLLDRTIFKYLCKFPKTEEIICYVVLLLNETSKNVIIISRCGISLWIWFLKIVSDLE